jgi:group I intron endonuclease
MIEVSIYTLANPETNEVRYIGKTKKKLYRRLSEHIATSKNLKDHRAKWIQSLLRQNLSPKIELLEMCFEKNWQETEKFWIRTLKFLGVNLVNQNEGGCGNNGHKFSEESKQKISMSLTGKKQSRETIEKRASQMRGRKLSAEHIAKCVATRISRQYKMSDSLKQKISDINKNKKLSEEHKAIFNYHAQLNNAKNSKKVAQYSLTGELLGVYSCAREASLKTSANVSNIRLCCKNKRKTSGGFMWKFA